MVEALLSDGNGFALLVAGKNAIGVGGFRHIENFRDERGPIPAGVSPDDQAAEGVGQISFAFPAQVPVNGYAAENPVASGCLPAHDLTRKQAPEVGRPGRSFGESGRQEREEA